MNYDEGGLGVDKQSRFKGMQFRRTTKMHVQCLKCLVPLCHRKVIVPYKGTRRQDLPAASNEEDPNEENEEESMKKSPMIVKEKERRPRGR